MTNTDYDSFTNDELASAIDYTFARCNQQYMQGCTNTETELYVMLKEHLTYLLELQRFRATMK